MHVTRRRHREPVSYHLLCDALTLRDTSESALLVHAIQRVVSGLVTHDHYANAAQSAAGELSSTKVKQQLAIAIAVDANPIAALFPPTVRAEDFESRWNALNEAAHFGVKTCLENFGTDAEEVSRISATGERDELFRAEMMSHFLELLSGGHRANVVDDGRAILTLSANLEPAASAIHEVLELLYAEPGIGIEQCAIQVGASLRTLQRQLARHGLLFAQLKQAVRITIAGYRMRNCDESLTTTAQVAGFFDSAHMIHAWQTACGISPSTYRSIAKLSVHAR
ncbi:AraC-type DNA-binding protein [Burkholderia sp. GAS332]|nr:AraC-type DNA-binding protein [Burkholderia sp. GAS332]